MIVSVQMIFVPFAMVLILPVFVTVNSVFTTRVVPFSGIAGPARERHPPPVVAGAHRDGPDQDRAADLHPREALPARDVLRLPRAPGSLRRVRASQLSAR